MTLDQIKLVVCLVLAAIASLFFVLWRSEVEAFAQYKAKVAAAGRAQEKETRRVNALHQKTLEDVSHAWNSQLPAVRAGAVAAYRRAHPERMFVACGGPVSGAAGDSQGADGAGQEQVADEGSCQLSNGFIQDCAEDALKVGQWQDVARRNWWRVE